MYSEWANDVKIQSMDETSQRRHIMLLCVTCDGELTKLTDNEIACKLRIKIDELQKTKDLFIKKGFIDDKWNMLNWSKRQFLSDSSAKRTKDWRDRKNIKNVTSHSCHSDGIVTPPDTDTDTDTYKKENNKRKKVCSELKIKKIKTKIQEAQKKCEKEFQENLELFKIKFPGIDYQEEKRKMLLWIAEKPVKSLKIQSWNLFQCNWLGRVKPGYMQPNKSNNRYSVDPIERNEPIGKPFHLHVLESGKTRDDLDPNAQIMFDRSLNLYKSEVKT